MSGPFILSYCRVIVPYDVVLHIETIGCKSKLAACRVVRPVYYTVVVPIAVLELIDIRSVSVVWSLSNPCNDLVHIGCRYAHVGRVHISVRTIEDFVTLSRCLSSRVDVVVEESIDLESSTGCKSTLNIGKVCRFSLRHWSLADIGVELDLSATAWGLDNLALGTADCD